MASTRKEFQRLAGMRAKEARDLAKVGHENAAYYLAGFVECALKACIAKKTRRHEFPPKDTRDVYSHNLDALLNRAGLQHALEEERKVNKDFDKNWTAVKSWSVDSRYEASALRGVEMVKAVNSANGVLRWIKRNW